MTNLYGFLQYHKLLLLKKAENQSFWIGISGIVTTVAKALIPNSLAKIIGEILEKQIFFSSFVTYGGIDSLSF